MKEKAESPPPLPGSHPGFSLPPPQVWFQNPHFCKSACRQKDTDSGTQSKSEKEEEISVCVWGGGQEWGALRKCQVIPGNSQESWRAGRVEPCLNIKGKSDSREGFKRARGSFRIKLDNVSHWAQHIGHS